MPDQPIAVLADIRNNRSGRELMSRLGQRPVHRWAFLSAKADEIRDCGNFVR
jgi:hypothetical protein